MKRNYWIGLAAFVLCLSLFFIIRSLKHHHVSVDPGFSEYIAAFTSGTVSSQTTVKVELVNEIPAVQPNAEVDQELFRFSPSIKGKAYWLDGRTIEFRPDKSLEQGCPYRGTFYLSKIIKGIAKKYQNFDFEFQTIKQAISIETDGYQPYVLTSLTWNSITGIARAADIVDNARIEEVIEAQQFHRKLKIRWTHNNANQLHSFTIDSVERRVDASEVSIDWNCKKIGADTKGSQKISIPSINDFNIIDAKVVQGDQQYIAIRFSDPLDPRQDLNGLIHLEDKSDLTFEIDKMVIKAYVSSQKKGTISVTVEPGILNISGGKLKETKSFELMFESIKPMVRLIGKGVILPNSNGLNFPFQTVNLKAVDLRIIKVFENNITQFLQVNQLDGSQELSRAGKLVLKKTIHLDAEKPVLLNKWTTYEIELSKLINQEPGAIYRVQLSFKKEYSIYPCDEQVKEEKGNMVSMQQSVDDAGEDDNNQWNTQTNYYDDEYYGYEGSYNWEERDDPCKASYFYGSHAQVSRNVFASDIGIIAKVGQDNILNVAVASLISTKPMGGVVIEVYDFQKQLLVSKKTDNDGFCSITLPQKGYVLIAKKGSQYGYLRIDDGSALSVSNFDVSGETIQKGLKGFIYGERGVWRPGDTVFLTFILEDKLKVIPANHPVVLELYNPTGQLTKKLVKVSATKNMYPFSFKTDENDPTGNWMVYIKLGGTTFSKLLKIETVKPNRLKILFDPGSGVLKDKVSGVLNAKWLHGAIAKSLKANVTVTLSGGHTSFKGYDSYVFDDPARKFETTDKLVFDGALDESGNAVVNCPLSIDNTAPGLLHANFITKVFEPGGDFSIDRFSAEYSPYKAYIGMKAPEDTYGYLYTDTIQNFDVVSLSPEGKPLSRSNLEVNIFKMEWRWWWDADGGSLANYSNSTYAKPVYSTKVSTMNGKTRVKYKLDYPEWGRYLIRITDPEGHSTGKVVYFDWPGWRGRANRSDSKGAVMLSFNADKKVYQVGDKATITVPSAAGGHMLVSVESGSQVLKSWWVETVARETKTSLEITDKMTPNVYVNVSLIQPHAQTINDLPIRMYGILPLAVENPATHLFPVLTMPDVLEPEKPFTIQIGEKHNHPMTYTIAIVDDGLLDLTRFKTPDPWTSFYGKEALGVKTWDLYDLVMGAFDGRIESLFAVGGDDAIKGGKSQKANRFKPVVKFLGPFSLTSGINRHTITLSQYVGSVRTMVIASDEAAYGKIEKTVPVRKPLMVLATLPRVLGPGEDVVLPVSVFAMEKSIKNVTVEVIPNELLQMNDARSKQLNIKETGEFDMTFNLKVVSREGVGKVRIIARSGNEKSEFEIELNVRNPNPRIVKVEEVMLEAGKSSIIPYKLIGTYGTNKATLEVSSIPPVDLNKRLRYLLTYPYGCVEQTTSSVFPQLYLEKFVELSNDARKNRDANILAGIQRLNMMIIADGGFGYWPGSITANEWGSCYAGHFLLEAEQKGYAIPSGFRKNWTAYQHKMARAWMASKPEFNSYDSELTQAYRLYTLALAKDPDLGAMNRLKETGHLSVSASWRLAAAYVMVGQLEIARQIITRAGDEIKGLDPFNETFGSETRDWAMMLETLTLMGEKTKAFNFLKKVAADLNHDRWLSTHTTAYALLSVAKFLEKENVSKQMNFTFSSGNKKNVNVISQTPIVQRNLEAASDGNGNVSLINNGSGLIFVRIITEGIPETGPVNGFENYLKMTVVFKSGNGNVLDVSKLSQGTDFVAEVTVKNIYPGYVTNLALKQIFPSGWEIGNDRMDKENVEDASDAGFTYQDVRDDRVYTFLDLENSHTKSFKVRLTAAYLGKFYFPGTLCEAMYEGSVNAFVPGKWVEVVR